jgi:hypothetical protein
MGVMCRVEVDWALWIVYYEQVGGGCRGYAGSVDRHLHLTLLGYLVIGKRREGNQLKSTQGIRRIVCSVANFSMVGSVLW